MTDIFKKLVTIYNMYKEQILYLFFGALTTVISIAVYAFFSELLNINVLAANLISWVIAVAFAYVTNRSFVFRSETVGAGSKLREAAAFYAGRLFTLLVEELLLFVFIELLTWPNIPVKVAAQVIIIILNYVISKFFIFKKN